MPQDDAFLDDLVAPHSEALKAGSAVTIGNFDGVHRGHRTIIDGLRDEATNRGLAAVALTFEPHPATVFHGLEPAAFRLTDEFTKRRRLAEAGIDEVVVARFSPEFAALTPERFVGSLLIDKLRARTVHVGYDFAFGRGRSGTTETLQELGARYGLSVKVVPPLMLEDRPVSSTRVRDAIRGGAMESAMQLLGRPFSLAGVTEHGAGRGRAMGIPTLNLYPTDLLLPPLGVYATVVTIDERQFRAVSNLGTRPTFDGDSTRVALETWVLDPYDSDQRGLSISVAFRGFIRAERRFDGPEALLAQIELDVQAANRIHDSTL